MAKFNWDDHPVASAKGSFNWDDHPVAAPEEAGFLEQLRDATVDQLPMIGGAVGGAAGLLGAGIPTLGFGAPGGAVVGSGLGYAGGQAAKNFINSLIAPEKAPQTAGEIAESMAMAPVLGADQELGGQALGAAATAARNAPFIKPFLDDAGQLVINGFNKAGKFVGDKAEKLAVSATGATGKQASQFADGTGRTLLDKGIVKFGRSQSGIAEAASDALDAEGGKIGSIVKGLSDKGAVGSREELVQGLQSKIAELGDNPGEAETVRKLKSILDDVAAGPEAPSLKAMEDTKRSFQSKVNYTDPDAQAAKAAAADLYKTQAEQIATKADPEAGQAFQEAKSMFGQLRPVADAAERRAMTTAQSPTGGLLDYVAYGTAGVPGVVAKKLVMPRVNSSLASSANGLAQMLQASPQAFGQFAKPLMDAAARGAPALAATHYLLQQNDPQYREKMKEMDGAPEEPAKFKSLDLSFLSGN